MNAISAFVGAIVGALVAAVLGYTYVMHVVLPQALKWFEGVGHQLGVEPVLARVGARAVVPSPTPPRPHGQCCACGKPLDDKAMAGVIIEAGFDPSAWCAACSHLRVEEARAALAHEMELRTRCGCDACRVELDVDLVHSDQRSVS